MSLPNREPSRIKGGLKGRLGGTAVQLVNASGPVGAKQQRVYLNFVIYTRGRWGRFIRR